MQPRAEVPEHKPYPYTTRTRTQPVPVHDPYPYTSRTRTRPVPVHDPYPYTSRTRTKSVPVHNPYPYTTRTRTQPEPVDDPYPYTQPVPVHDPYPYRTRGTRPVPYTTPVHDPYPYTSLLYPNYRTLSLSEHACTTNIYSHAADVQEPDQINMRETERARERERDSEPSMYMRAHAGLWLDRNACMGQCPLTCAWFQKIEATGFRTIVILLDGRSLCRYSKVAVQGHHTQPHTDTCTRPCRDREGFGLAGQ